MYHDADPRGAKPYSLKVHGDNAVSPHFTVREFACHDGSDLILVHPKLVEGLEALRARVGGPITILSAYRTTSHNKKVGGAAKSRHLLGMAADVRCQMAPAIVAKIARELGFGGVGRYDESRFTHVDVDKVRSWSD